MNINSGMLNNIESVLVTLQRMVDRNKEWRPLQKMFTEVPCRYDLMNRLLTFRFDEIWRKKAARECLAGKPSKILDLCTGTGDLAIQIARGADRSVEIIGLDYSTAMLTLAEKKASKKGFDRIKFINGDASSMPFDNESMDAIGIAFAFRNLTYKNPDRKKFLGEIYRILSPKGRFIIVETSQPDSEIMRILFYAYLNIFVAGLGGWLSGHKNAYKYLAASARNFYAPAEVRVMLKETGFRQVQYKKLFDGIAGITVGLK
jgi:demethylmenaquinone methyltransferase/2-methoxy-6-polyprenyl-1,4-benzoquinol methylase